MLLVTTVARPVSVYVSGQKAGPQVNCSPRSAGSTCRTAGGADYTACNRHSADVAGGLLDRLVDVLRAHVELLGHLLLGLQPRLVQRLLQRGLADDEKGGLSRVDGVPELPDVRPRQATPEMATRRAYGRCRAAEGGWTERLGTARACRRTRWSPRRWRRRAAARSCPPARPPPPHTWSGSRRRIARGRPAHSRPAGPTRVDHAPDVVRQAAVGERHVRSAFHHQDLGLLVEPTQARRT